MGDYTIYVVLVIAAALFIYNFMNHKKRTKARKSRRFMDDHQEQS